MNSFFLTVWHTGRSTFFGFPIAIALLGCQSVSMALSATNPWSRAIGEAVELQDATEDLRNRLSRLYPGSLSAVGACQLDESASHLRDLIKYGADFHHLQADLEHVSLQQQELCRRVACEYRIHLDDGVRSHLRRVDDRLEALIRDLSKCSVPMTWSAPSPWSGPDYPPSPIPFFSNRPIIPASPTYAPPFLDRSTCEPGYYSPTPRSGRELPSPLTPGMGRSLEPRFWQGRLPSSNVYPMESAIRRRDGW
jgi:hypothetical protein